MPTGSWRHPPRRRFIRLLPANPHRAEGLLHLSAPASVQAPAYLARQQEPSFANASAQQRPGQHRCSQDHSCSSATIHQGVRPRQPEALPRHPAAVR
jgi:hypothetical protein